MFIQTEETPNPLTLKFIPGKVLMESGTQEFVTAEEAKASPLAEKLLNIDGVRSIFFGRDFISITKIKEKDWYILKPPILGAIMEHFVAEKPLFYEKKTNKLEKNGKKIVGQEKESKEDAIVNEIKELLETRVRPAVAQDGGDIIFDKFEEGIVYVKLKGACSGCPSSTMTLKSGIEKMLKYYIPEVLEVRAL